MQGAESGPKNAPGRSSRPLPERSASPGLGLGRHRSWASPFLGVAPDHGVRLPRNQFTTLRNGIPVLTFCLLSTVVSPMPQKSNTGLPGGSGSAGLVLAWDRGARAAVPDG